MSAPDELPSKSRIVSGLFKPIDIASLAVFRILFGGILMWEMWRFLLNGWVKLYYVKPRLNFYYYGFEWVKPLPGEWMTFHFYGLWLCALFITIGLFYRVSMILFTLGFTYVFLLEQAKYLNHFYFVILVCLLMIFMPAHRALSLDSRFSSRIRSETISAWPVWTLRLQMGAVYLFGGIAKCNEDWLRGFPMRYWLSDRMHFPLIGVWFDQGWMALFFSYGGLLLDLFALPLLIWRKTRLATYLALVAFHLTNHNLFGIGIFPWFSIAITLIYFEPGWPRRVFNWPRTTSEPATLSSPVVGKRHRVITWVLVAYLSIQVFLPLRHWLYPGRPAWTEEGHRFSWHMKLRGKDGKGRFRVKDPKTEVEWIVDPDAYLKSWQLRKCLTRPYLMVQFAKHLQNEWAKRGIKDVEVYADVSVALNGRRKQRFVDPNIDLTKQGIGPFDSWDWVEPLKEPLRYPKKK